MDEDTIGIVTFKVMFKGSNFIQIGLNDIPNEVFKGHKKSLILQRQK